MSQETRSTAFGGYMQISRCVLSRQKRRKSSLEEFAMEIKQILKHSKSRREARNREERCTKYSRLHLSVTEELLKLL